MTLFTLFLIIIPPNLIEVNTEFEQFQHMHMCSCVRYIFTMTQTTRYLERDGPLTDLCTPPLLL